MSDQNVAPDAEPVAAPPAEPVVAAPPAAPAEPAAAPAPWAKDLEEVFADEAVRGQVDGFMREKYQPYVTRIETEAAPARQLYEALQGDDSLETYLDLAEQLYGEEVAELLASTIIEKYENADAAAPAAEPEAAPAEPTRDPALQALLDEKEANEAKEHYWAEMARVKEADARVDQDLFHPFVMGAGGDFDIALGQYQAWHAKAYPAGAPAEVPAPPATLGTDGVGGPTPPVAKRYTSYDEAMEDTFAEMRAQRNAPPPAVGSA